MGEHSVTRQRVAELAAGGAELPEVGLAEAEARAAVESQDGDVEAGKRAGGGHEARPATRASAPGKKQRQPRPFFNPSDSFCHWWSGVVSLAFLYNFWSLSYRFAFREIDDSTVTVWFALDYFADFIYLNDIFVNFRTGYLEDGVLERDPKKIGLHYRESTLFYLDMLCLLPFDFLYLSFSYCSILRCNKLVKIYKFWAFVDRTERHTNYPNVFRTFTLVHYILVIFHWNACLFHMISKHNVVDIGSLYKIDENQCDDILCQYLHAFYWSTLALTLIGDLPRPRTRGEFVYVIVELCFGLFLFASVLGHVANIVTNVSAARKEFQAKLDSVKTFMRTRRVSDDLQNKVIRWFDYLWHSQKSSDEERSVACLPDRLKAEIAIHVNLDTLKRVDIFQNTEAGFLCELVLRLKSVLFSPGDFVCRKNEVGHEMYIVSRGLLEVVTDDGERVVATFRAGSYFGEIAVLNVGSAGNKRTASVRSVGYSDLFCLSKRDLWDVLKDYPNAEARIRAVAEERLTKLTSGSGGARKRRSNASTGGQGERAKRKPQASELGQPAESHRCGAHACGSHPYHQLASVGPLLHLSPARNGLSAPPTTEGAHRRRLCSSSSCCHRSLAPVTDHHRPMEPATCGHMAPPADSFCCGALFSCAHSHRATGELQPDIWLAPATPRLSSSSRPLCGSRGDTRTYDEHRLQASLQQRDHFSNSASNFHAVAASNRGRLAVGSSDSQRHQPLAESRSFDYESRRQLATGIRPAAAMSRTARIAKRGRPRTHELPKSAADCQAALSSGGASGSSPSSTLSGTATTTTSNSKATNQSAVNRDTTVPVVAGAGEQASRRLHPRSSSLTQVADELTHRDGQLTAVDEPQRREPREQSHLRCRLANDRAALVAAQQTSGQERSQKQDLMMKALQKHLEPDIALDGRHQPLGSSINSLDFEPIEPHQADSGGGESAEASNTGECLINMIEK